ncbi:hypothetical protein F5Y15DRAFT_430234 [Xylariaceae sp. FL0016]|nr:hypothetical protein F5Y15DRAFT_430234 [Xylariaceae sp. FL0016]
MSVPIPEDEEKYMLAHIDDTLVPNLIACIAVCGAATTLCLGLRVWSRRIVYGHIRTEINDWLLLCAWFFYSAESIMLGIATIYGTGRHIIVVENYRMYKILGLCSEIFYFEAIAFVKLSILSLYWSIFPNRAFRLWLWTVSAFVSAWAIAFSLSTIFQCIPLSYLWNSEQKGYCINYGYLQLSSGIINIITDFLILALPLPIIWKLNITKHKKWQVSLTLAIGCTACLVSVVRLAYAQTLGGVDGSWDGVPLTYISIVEVTVGILAASIPTYKPLYRRLTQRSTPHSSREYSHVNDREVLRRGTFGRKANVTAGTHGGSSKPIEDATHQIELMQQGNMGGHWLPSLDDDESRLYDPRQIYRHENPSATP